MSDTQLSEQQIREAFRAGETYANVNDDEGVFRGLNKGVPDENEYVSKCLSTQGEPQGEEKTFSDELLKAWKPTAKKWYLAGLSDETDRFEDIWQNGTQPEPQPKETAEQEAEFLYNFGVKILKNLGEFDRMANVDSFLNSNVFMYLRSCKSEKPPKDWFDKGYLGYNPQGI